MQQRLPGAIWASGVWGSCSLGRKAGKGRPGRPRRRVPLRLLRPGLPSVPQLWAGHCDISPVHVPPGMATHPRPHSVGCASLLIKGEFPLWMSDKRQHQGVPLLNPKESDLSLSGGELRATLGLLALSHPREDKTSPHDPSQRPEPGQTGAWSHPRDKIWAGRIHQWLTMDKVCPLCPPRALPAIPPDQKRGCI